MKTLYDQYILQAIPSNNGLDDEADYKNMITLYKLIILDPDSEQVQNMPQHGVDEFRLMLGNKYIEIRGKLYEGGDICLSLYHNDSDRDSATTADHLTRAWLEGLKRACRGDCYV